MTLGKGTKLHAKNVAVKSVSFCLTKPSGHPLECFRLACVNQKGCPVGFCL